jgi:hypothetical protein
MTGEKIDCDDADKIRLFASSMAGIERELKNPSVAFLVKHGRFVRAVKLYKHKYDCTLREAHDAVSDIADRIEKGEIQ